MRRSPISFADYLLVSDQLAQHDSEVRRRIAAMLGFEWEAKRGSQEEAGRTTTSAQDPTNRRESREAIDPQAKRSGVLKQSDRTHVLGKTEFLWMEDLSQLTVQLPQWVPNVLPMPEPVVEETDDPPEVQPLFRPRWTRALLYAALAHVDESGPIDIERAVERLARFEQVTRLPRRKRFRLKNDLQLLIDVSQSMRPFAQDQFAIIGNIERLVATPNIKQLYFSGCPTRGAGAADDWPWTTYRPPQHPGSLVLVLTDLGATRAVPGIDTGLTDEWLRFANSIIKAGCQVVALVPFPLRRVRPAIRRAMPVIPWDRSTTTRVIQKIRFNNR